MSGKTIKKVLRAVDQFLDRHIDVLILLFVVLALRLPTLFDPYWYGDEAIYLTIGTALRHGARLYADIIDHKTPLIYFFAMVPGQLWFRLLTMAVMGTTSFVFYRVLQLLTKGKVWSFVGALTLTVVMNIPMLEGTIPNGEHFFLLFTLTSLWLTLLANQHQRGSKVVWFLVGALASLGVHVKVPALFEMVPIGLLLVWPLFATIKEHTFHRKKVLLSFTQTVQRITWFSLGFATPIFFFIGLFAWQGSLVEYWQYGLIYNFRYSGYWQPASLPHWAAPLLQLPMKLKMYGVWAIVSLLCLHIHKHGKAFFLTLTWFGASLLASTLSNRPYPHYFLQVVPAVVALLTIALHFCSERALTFFSRFVSVTNLSLKKMARSFVSPGLVIVMSTGAIVLLIATFTGLGVGTYETLQYYRKFFTLVSGRVTYSEYAAAFHPYWRDNAKLMPRLVADKDPYLFIWGTNALLYAEAQKVPAGRFTVSFHIHDFHAYDETLQAVKRVQPTYIVIMKDETQPLPGLTSWLAAHYAPLAEQFDTMTVWKKSTP